MHHLLILSFQNPTLDLKNLTPFILHNTHNKHLMALSMYSNPNRQNLRIRVGPADWREDTI